eukprot:CAMPEP_0175121444 /NCGR_PEP_ID=MMETSP0087-20121206/1170_1 /TAXON_ID=136419 /ORGANISM="Unknown Unknown, Strain D1" /LENGTH=263 /DNA_ID=CAMNT_0016402983 /DNA_START=241 /DNA_END=1029 /DNA_ORIENTATION=+
MALQHAKQLVESFPEKSIICYTDGGCSGNPGPCGAGTVVQFPAKDGSSRGVRTIETSVSIAQGTNNIGELWAIGAALQLIQQQQEKEEDLTNRLDNGQVHILTDSRYAHGLLCLGWKPKANTELATAVKTLLDSCWQTGLKAKIHWVAGHAGVPGNEKADDLATSAVAGNGAISISDLDTVLKHPSFVLGQLFLPSQALVTSLCLTGAMRVLKTHSADKRKAVTNIDKNVHEDDHKSTRTSAGIEESSPDFKKPNKRAKTRAA